jgi:hypothetical protein
MIIVCCVVPVCATLFAYTINRKRSIEAMNGRDTLSYNLHHVRRTKSALKKSDSISSHRKSVQFDEVVLEVFDLINENEQEDLLSCKPSYPKVIKSTLKKEKVYVPIRCSNTVFPKTIINEYNGEVINFDEKEQKEEKQTNNEDTKSISIDNELPEIVIVKSDDTISKDLLNKQVDNSISNEITNNVAETVITSVANNTETNQINVSKSNTFPRRSRPNRMGHRRQASVRLKCIY